MGSADGLNVRVVHVHVRFAADVDELADRIGSVSLEPRTWDVKTAS